MAWLNDQFAKVIRFAVGSIRPQGAFEWLEADGSHVPGKHPQLFLTARMTYVAALAAVRGIPGSGALLDHGVDALLALHRDPAADGWIADPLTDPNTRKMTYDHVHVGFAAANAVAAGSERARDVLDHAIHVIDTHLWRPDEAALVESYAADWTDSEPYRGANSNMHGVEAFLAIGVATGDPVWFRRALAISERLIDGAARANHWLMPEHFTADWEPLPDYNRDEPAHPFRPYGWTPGHAFEWSRLLLELAAALGDTAPGWLAESARALGDTALATWGIDGTPGFGYTTDWDGVPVVTTRLHWPLCEAIQAVALLHRATGDPAYESAYRRCWDHAAAHWIDETGMWANELTPELTEGSTIWRGRPDVYHTVGALLGPQVPAAPNLAAALAVAGTDITRAP